MNCGSILIFWNILIKIHTHTQMRLSTEWHDDTGLEKHIYYYFFWDNVKTQHTCLMSKL